MLRRHISVLELKPLVLGNILVMIRSSGAVRCAYRIYQDLTSVMIMNLRELLKIIIEVIIENYQFIGLCEFFINSVYLDKSLASGRNYLQVRMFLSDIFLEYGGE